MIDISILIVEDESIIAHSLAKKIESFGYQVAKICTNGDDAIAYVHREEVAVILMDINLCGDMDGIKTAEEIIKYKKIPVIYLTAYMDEHTIERAIKTNPSAYLSKPVSSASLLASLKIALKTNGSSFFKGDIILDDEFSYDSSNRQLFHKGEYVKLSKKETQLLSLLLYRKNQIVPIDVIENEIWPDKEPNENTRRALVSYLRTKLNHKFIETISGIGYRLNVKPLKRK